ncbi:hypothetical protein AAZX31_13G087900 [Glycine max]
MKKAHQILQMVLSCTFYIGFLSQLLLLHNRFHTNSRRWRGAMASSRSNCWWNTRRI